MKILWYFVTLGLSTANYYGRTTPSYDWRNTNNLPRGSEKRTFTVDYVSGTFRMNEEPFMYKSGSIHYSRLHEDSWASRLEQIRGMGLNAIQYYVPWNYHEVFKGQYIFNGNRNFSRFSELAMSAGMYTIMRIGPYICAEWENGGFPYFVTNSNASLRTNDSAYLEHVESWFNVLLPRVKPMLYKNGGSVITIQIENEYGLFGKCDKAYMRWLRDLVWKHLGDDVVLFTTDPSDVVECGSVEEVLPTIDFGPANRRTIEKQVLALQKILPGGKGPLVNSEYYTGWFTYWGQLNQSIATDQEIVDGVRSMMEMKINFNFYMVFGGTNTDYWNGAHSEKPVITSYDYGAPIREDGSLRPLYKSLTRTFSGRGGRDDGTTSVGDIRVSQVATMPGLIANAWTQGKFCSKSTFEECDHPYGLMCYITESEISTSGYEYDYTSGVHSRNRKICVENYGRINYPSSNSQNGVLNGSISQSIIIDDPLILECARGGCTRFGNSGAGVYRGRFTLNIVGELHMHISFENWGKGFLFVNGHNLGRYWSIGPQLSLFVDKNYLNSKGENEVVFLELKDVNRGCEGDTCYITTSKTAIWTKPLRD